MLESLFSATISVEYRNGLGHKTKDITYTILVMYSMFSVYEFDKRSFGDLVIKVGMPPRTVTKICHHSFGFCRLI